jgi:hypothetical protein
MATRSGNKDRAGKRIDGKISELPLKDIEIKEYVRDTDLTNLPRNVAYRVDGVHLYADILNLSEMLHVTDVEGEICHRRTLRFLNLHYRAVYRIIQRVDAIFVDFHNQRLHSVVSKPYDAEADRVHKAVAMGQLIIDVHRQALDGSWRFRRWVGSIIVTSGVPPERHTQLISTAAVFAPSSSNPAWPRTVCPPVRLSAVKTIAALDQLPLELVPNRR